MRLSELPAAALLIVFAVVSVVIGSMVIGGFYDSAHEADSSVNATIVSAIDSGDDALGNITDWADIITLVVAAAVIIGILGLMRLGGGGL